MFVLLKKTITMKKLLTTSLLLFLFFTSSIYAQERKIEIYTTIKDASFIPIIENKALSNIPVDTFIYVVETDTIINLSIDFPNKSVMDLFITIDFDGIKHKKYQIVYKNKAQKTLDLLTDTPENDTLFDLFSLKNESFKNYLKNVNK